MNGITFSNNTGRALLVVIEPIAEEYKFLAGDKIEIGQPIYLDSRKVIDIRLDPDLVVIFAPEDAVIKRNGEIVGPDNL